jgi:hypothetical protein
MQLTTNNGVTFGYPDDPCFVFNVCPIRVSGTVDKLAITMDDGVNSYSVEYDTPGGGTVDISEYLQGLFDGLAMGDDIDYTQQTALSEMGKPIDISLSASYEGTEVATADISLFCIWGGLKAGEQFNQLRTVTWFKNFPFTIGYYAAAAQNIAAGPNSSPSQLTSLAGQGLYNILIDDAMGGQYITYYDVIGTLAQTSFEDIFDLTFYYTLDGTQAEKVRIRLVDETVNEGIYLRWIDRHGMWNYWLFKQGDPTRNAKSDGTFNRNNLDKWEEIYHWQGSAGRRQNLTRNDVQPVCAPLVDQSTFDMLQDVTTSPCVDMYLGKDNDDTPRWTAVTIEAGGYTKDVDKPLQDFVMNIVLPEIPIQQL